MPWSYMNFDLIFIIYSLIFMLVHYSQVLIVLTKVKGSSYWLDLIVIVIAEIPMLTIAMTEILWATYSGASVPSD